MATIQELPMGLRSQFSDLKRANGGLQQTIEQLDVLSHVTTDFLLLCLTDDPSSRVRDNALRALGERGGILARLAARAALGDSESFIRSTAAELLGSVGNRLDIPRLVEASRSDEWEIRASAATSLGSLAKRAAWGPLKELIEKDPHRAVRRDAAIALAKIGDPRASILLEQALDKENDELARVGIVFALYTLGEGEWLNNLLSLLKSEDALVRHNVVNILDPEDVVPNDRECVMKALVAFAQSEPVSGIKEDAEVTLGAFESCEGK